MLVVVVDLDITEKKDICLGGGVRPPLFCLILYHYLNSELIVMKALQFIIKPCFSPVVKGILSIPNITNARGVHFSCTT